jgi:hypothetical protein
MEYTNRCKHEYHRVKLCIPYLLLIICLADRFDRLFRMIIGMDLTGLISYFSYLSDLWQSNRILTMIVVVMCLLGMSKVLPSLGNVIRTFTKLLKTILRRPIIVNVRIYAYLSIIIWKFYRYLPIGVITSNLKYNDIIQQVTFWRVIRQDFMIYRYSSILTLGLFLLGVYNTINNGLVQRLTKQFVCIVSKPIRYVHTYLCYIVPTPLSVLVLVLLDEFTRHFPSIIDSIFTLLTIRSIMFVVGINYCVYRMYRYLYSTSTYDLDFTGQIHLNDVSRLNTTRVYALFYPRTLNDIEYLIFKAKSERRTISIRGQAHTMGGQTLPSRTSRLCQYVCDLKYLNHIEYDRENEHVLVEAGATWTHVINKLNRYGRSPVIMQSYCTFSVAGTISVNAHGITSDDAMYKSVVAIEYIDMNGRHIQCSREQQPELFSLIIGGYGLFGIITRLRLATVPNVKTSLEYIRLQVGFSCVYVANNAVHRANLVS